MVEILYFVHGTTLDNERKIASGQRDIILSQRGIEQTKRAAALIDGREFEEIFCSDLRRAAESAEILFADRKDKIKTDMRLRECDYGELSGRAADEIEYSRHIDVPFPEGESLRDVEERMRRFLREINGSGYSKIAIVSHRAPQLALDVILSGMPWDEAIEKDWRICGCWKPGWRYALENV